MVFENRAIAVHAALTAAHGVAKVADNVDLEALTLVGAANAKWLPLVLSGDYDGLVEQTAIFGNLGCVWSNLIANDTEMYFRLMKSVLLGSKILHVKAVRVGIYTANGTNFVTSMTAFKTAHDSQVQIDVDVTDRTAPGVYTLTFSSAESLENFSYLSVQLNTVLTDMYGLEIEFVEAEVYYA